MKSHKLQTKLFIELTIADKIQAERAAKRLVDIELGITAPRRIVHKSKKTYTRKQKHKSIV